MTTAEALREVAAAATPGYPYAVLSPALALRLADLIDAAEALNEGERFDEELFWERYAALRAALAALEPLT